MCSQAGRVAPGPRAGNDKVASRGVSGRRLSLAAFHHSPLVLTSIVNARGTRAVHVLKIRVFSRPALRGGDGHVVVRVYGTKASKMSEKRVSSLLQLRSLRALPGRTLGRNADPVTSLLPLDHSGFWSQFSHHRRAHPSSKSSRKGLEGSKRGSQALNLSARPMQMSFWVSVH